MKLYRYPFLLILFFILSNPIFGLNIDDFYYEANLNPRGVGAFSILIKDDLAGLKLSSDRIRIFDTNNLEVPFFIHKNYSSNPNQYDKPIHFYNISLIEGKYQQFQFKILKNKEIDRIKIIAKQKSYSHTLSIFGRESEKSQFKLIKSKLRIIKLNSSQQGINYRHNIIKFPPQRYMEYKIIIDLDNNKKPLNIDTVSYREKTQKKEIPQKQWNANFKEVDLKDFPYIYQNSLRSIDKSKLKTYLIELPHRNGRVDSVEVITTNNYFQRKVSLYRMQKLKNQNHLTYFGSTTLFKYDKDQNNKIIVSTKYGKKLLLIVHNEDNYPLSIKNIKVKYKIDEIRFFLDDTPSFKFPIKLFFKTKNPEKPNYDIRRRVQSREYQFQEVTVSNIKKNINYNSTKSTPKSEQVPYLIYIVFLALALFAIYYLYKFIADTDEPEIKK